MRSQLRQDLVSGDWIVIAPKRKLRPHQFKKKEKRKKAPQAGCPFEIEKIMDKDLIFYYPEASKNSEREIAVIKNKFPAFEHKRWCAKKGRVGPYNVMEGVGYQEIVITRDHDKNFPDLSKKAAFEVLNTFQKRYRVLSGDSCLAYISIFQNWGPGAGASIYHPHYQIISIPVVPPDVEHSLEGSLEYFKEHRKCVHCVMIGWEKRKRERIVAENKGAIAFTPFVSRQPFEIRIFPKDHSAYFEDSSPADIEEMADVLQKALETIKRNLSDSDYNFFIHTAPVLNKSYYGHYHWHIEVLPKMSIGAGFELGTGIDIVMIDPTAAAKVLTR